MSKIAIVTDSTAGIPVDLVEKYQINVVPLQVIWGETTYRDGVDLSAQEFYQMLPKIKAHPSTSQPSIAAFAEIFEKLIKEKYQVLTLTISSKLSGTLDSATQAKAQFPKAKIELVDTLETSVPLAILVLLAARAIRNGANIDQAKELVEKAVPKMRVYFALETLEYLHKGGRIGGASRFLGTALNLKPILELRDGKIEAIEKIRTSRKARERLLDLVETHISPEEKIHSIGIIHADEEEGAYYLLKEVRKRFQAERLLVGPLSPVIGVHGGPGLVGIAILAGLEETPFLKGE